MRGVGWILVAVVMGVTMSGLSTARASDTVTVYVGTYTKTSSRGIYWFTLDRETGAMSAPSLAAETTNPSFLALHPNGKVLYAVGEVDAFGGAKTGFVSAFAIDPSTHRLTLVNTQPSGGADPCHLVVDRAGTHVLVANYTSGTVAVLPVEADGRLRPATAVMTHEGHGPDAERQPSAHAHGIYLDAAERFAYAPDLGADRVFVYRYEASTGTLQPRGAGTLPAGAGPRHLVLDRDGRRAFVINELANTITAFGVDSTVGTLSVGASTSTLPNGFTGRSYTAEIALSGDGRFLYGSNRGHDTIAVFQVGSGTGPLQTVAHVPAGGRFPRHFAIDPTGRWMLVAHQNSDSVAAFRVDAETGVPQATGARLSMGAPVCVLFVPATAP